MLSSRWRSSLIAIGSIAVIYFAASKLSFRLISGEWATPVWPAAGVALACLLMLGNRFWPVIFAVASLSYIAEGASWMAATGFAAAHVTEALVGVVIVSYVASFRWHLGYFDILIRTVLIALLTPLSGATIGATVLWLWQAKPLTQWPASWSAWWLGHMLGLLVLAPVAIPFLASVHAGWKDWNKEKLVRIIPVLTSVGLICGVLIFRVGTYLPLFLLFPPMLFLTARLHEAAPALAATVIAFVAIWGTKMGRGPFVAGSGIDLSALVFFLVAVMVNALAFSSFRRARNLALPGTILLTGWLLGACLYASLDASRTISDRSHFDSTSGECRRKYSAGDQELREYATERQRIYRWNPANRPGQVEHLRPKIAHSGLVSRR